MEQLYCRKFLSPGNLPEVGKQGKVLDLDRIQRDMGPVLGG